MEQDRAVLLRWAIPSVQCAWCGFQVLFRPIFVRTELFSGLNGLALGKALFCTQHTSDGAEARHVRLENRNELGSSPSEIALARGSPPRFAIRPAHVPEEPRIYGRCDSHARSGRGRHRDRLQRRRSGALTAAPIPTRRPVGRDLAWPREGQEPREDLRLVRRLRSLETKQPDRGAIRGGNMGDWRSDHHRARHTQGGPRDSSQRGLFLVAGCFADPRQDL